MLDRITPLILTRNEAPNIERTLSKLKWAREIVVLDSYSSDHTDEIVSGFAHARLVRRKFDSHAGQWNYGLNSTGISTEWVLALDADYVLTESLVDEIANCSPSEDTAAYRADFTYVSFGRPLRGCAYGPVTILYRRAAARYIQDGHTQRLVVAGRIARLNSRVLHDDRKRLDRWVEAQRRYMKLEAQKLLGIRWSDLSAKNKLRKLKVVSPCALGVYCLLVKGALFDGRAGLYYALQRVFAELLLSLYLMEETESVVRIPAPDLTNVTSDR